MQGRWRRSHTVVSQAPVWDWVKGAPYGIKTSYCLEDDPNEEFCFYRAGDTIRLEANADCASCPDDQLANCCSFRYEEGYGIPADMVSNPDLHVMSPVMNYIAGFITYEEMQNLPERYKTFYCMGSDTDGGCGSEPDQTPCTVVVDDSNRSQITSSQVERYTFEDLVDVNGGRRDPPLRAESDLRHGLIVVTQRQPSEAEVALYTMLMRHHEVETLPHARLASVFGDRQNPLVTWSYTTQGRSALHSRLHGIACGGGLQVPSCSDTSSDPCSVTSCGQNAKCLNLDGRAFCMCEDGFVGDGTLCVLPSATVRYPLPTAHELYASGRADCFGSDWPESIGAADIPAYPGGIAPYRIDSSSGVATSNGSCALLDLFCFIIEFISWFVAIFFPFL